MFRNTTIKKGKYISGMTRTINDFCRHLSGGGFWYLLNHLMNFLNIWYRYL